MDSPDDLLSYADIATLMASRGHTIKASSLRAMRRMGQMPAPDELPVPDRPRWRRETIVAWLDSRPGKGARTDRRQPPRTNDAN
ncbi:MarR family transcriptional regulator [Frankia sp. AgB32]|uniref:MarR family transcriptional regulator n=1 Tax=Frankia sp. AgB32 TaxID=631119 RepID=UPI00200D0217|nr:MarR family transcriptional regulator [Frankia sp. AgB32]MCK9895219.1 MarR family transcriptional regulator [Frankia sp. AgB32]